mgnify:CR=1 FL=1
MESEPETAANDTVEAAVASEQQAPSTRRAQRQQAIEPTARAESAEPEGAGERTPALRFCSRFYALGDKLAVLSEAPHDGSQHDEAEATRLLAAILRALEVPAARLAAATDVLNWPLTPEQPAAETGAEHASRALGGFLTQTWEQHGYANLLVFSSQLQELLPGYDRSEGASDYQPNARNYRITSTQSLAAMCAVPELKREVWDHLQPLRERLK